MVDNTLVESELFGHEGGAATGAQSRKPARRGLLRECSSARIIGYELTFDYKSLLSIGRRGIPVKRMPFSRTSNGKDSPVASERAEVIRTPSVLTPNSFPGHRRTW